MIRLLCARGWPLAVAAIFFAAPSAHARQSALSPVVQSGDATLLSSFKVDRRVFYGMGEDAGTTLAVTLSSYSRYEFTIRGSSGRVGFRQSGKRRENAELSFAWGRGDPGVETATVAIAPYGLYTATLNITALDSATGAPVDPPRAFAASWSVEKTTRLVPGGRLVATIPASKARVRTVGSCLAVRSTQVVGIRIQCFGDPGSRAVLSASYGAQGVSIGGFRRGSSFHRRSSG